MTKTKEDSIVRAIRYLHSTKFKTAFFWIIVSTIFSLLGTLTVLSIKNNANGEARERVLDITLSKINEIDKKLDNKADASTNSEDHKEILNVLKDFQCSLNDVKLGVNKLNWIHHLESISRYENRVYCQPPFQISTPYSFNNKNEQYLEQGP